MIPHFTDRPQFCERCEEVILIGYEAEISTDGYFCSEECAKEHLYNGSDFQKVYLTTDKLFRGGY